MGLILAEFSTIDAVGILALVSLLVAALHGTVTGRRRQPALGVVDQLRAAATQPSEDQTCYAALVRANCGPALTHQLLEQIGVSTDTVLTPALHAKLVDCLAKSIAITDEVSDLRPSPVAPTVVLLLGINGVGKTTTAAKLAHFFVEQGKSIELAACDTFRAGATEQLATHASEVGVKLHRTGEGSRPVSLLYQALETAAKRSIDVLLCDTSGRLESSTNLLAELSGMASMVEKKFPDHNCIKLMCLSAHTGINAQDQLAVFHDAVSLDGVIITQCDSAPGGGGALAACAATGIPVALTTHGRNLGGIARARADDLAKVALA